MDLFRRAGKKMFLRPNGLSDGKSGVVGPMWDFQWFPASVRDTLLIVLSATGYVR